MIFVELKNKICIISICPSIHTLSYCMIQIMKDEHLTISYTIATMIFVKSDSFFN